MSATTRVTSLRDPDQRRLDEIGSADLLVGVPCFNNDATIGRVVGAISSGLSKHFSDRRSVIVVADGGSTDDTREVAAGAPVLPWQERLVTIYRGPGGKGSALRAIFEAADRLGARACAVVDADLRSITPDWLLFLLEPILSKGYEFVAPVYTRYKYDGTITNNIVYPLVRALYGESVRQPIGGDFGFSGGLARHYLEEDVWDTDVARFGIDIWMTTTAIVQNAKVCQANLGVKVHDAKDPAASLGPMFRQVCGTLFYLLEQHENFWLPPRGRNAPPLFGLERTLEPEPITVNQPRMAREFREGLRLFGPLWIEMFSSEVMDALRTAAALPDDRFELPARDWARLLYELAAKYHQLREHRLKMLTTMVPLYLGRVASFVNEAREMTSTEAETLIEEQAALFEEEKPYFARRWCDAESTGALCQLLAGHA